MKKKIFILFFFLLTLALNPFPTKATNEDCSFKDCSSSTQECIKTGATKVVSCYKIKWLHLGFTFEMKDLGQQYCFDQKTGTTRENDKDCTDGTTTGKCNTPRKDALHLPFKLPAETGEIRDVKTCTDKGTTTSPIPDVPTDDAKKIDCEILPSTGYSDTDTFHIILDTGDANSRYILKRSDTGEVIDDLMGQKLNNAKVNGNISLETKLALGTYSVNVVGYDYDENGAKAKQQCTTNQVEVKAGEATPTDCSIAASPDQSTTPFPKDTKIIVTIIGLAADTEYDISLIPLWEDPKQKKTDNTGQIIFDFKIDHSPTLIVSKDGAQVCNSLNFVSETSDDAGAFEGPADLVLPVISPPCDDGQWDAKGNCKSLATGFGFSIPTDPSGFIKALFGVILGMSGGIAAILIIISGYKMIMSRGNPEKLQGAKQSLTAAVVGLLFIIFSLVILEVIGVDILQLPGFS